MILHRTGDAGANRFAFSAQAAFTTAGRTINGAGGVDSIVLRFNPNLDDSAWVGVSNMEVLQLNGTSDAVLKLGGQAVNAFPTGLVVNAPHAHSVYLDASNWSYIDGGSYTPLLTINGSLGNDTMFDSSHQTVLNGGAGDDFLCTTGSGSSTFNGEAGNDTIYARHGSFIDGGAGADSIGSAGSNTVFGGAGDDTIWTLDGDWVDAGAGNDSIFGSGNGGTYAGGTGNDTINLDVLKATLSGGDGNDVIETGGAATSFDTIDGGNGNDLLTFGGGDNQVKGGAGNDTIIADRSAGHYGLDTMDGGSGNDLMTFRGTHNRVLGGTGSDTIIDTSDEAFGAGFDTLIGGAGADQFHFNGRGANHETIRDFTVGVDRLFFAPGVLDGLNTPGALNLGQLVPGSHPKQGQFGYDAERANLYYQGFDTHTPTLLIHFTNHAAITLSDIWVG